MCLCIHLLKNILVTQVWAIMHKAATNICVQVWCGPQFSIHDPMPFLWPLKPCPVLVCSMSMAELMAFFSRFLQHFVQLDSQLDYTYIEGKGHILLTLIPTTLKDQPILLKFMNKSYLFHYLINS